MTDGGQQRRVVHAVGVGVALTQVDVVLASEVPDRLELARRPDERSGQRPGVRVSVGLDRITGRHDPVEAEPIGERLDQVVRRRGRQHDRTTCGAVRLEDGLGEGLDQVHQLIGDTLGGGPNR